MAPYMQPLARELLARGSVQPSGSVPPDPFEDVADRLENLARAGYHFNAITGLWEREAVY
ncbi:hypothetical protein [Aestuariimicrobium ganziense]|uniref:hypothetical protein n=1 Tax=Aestuariimicrobium ganziense TaxID=2773677 RepID=UPI0019451C58|nr:hypothetical protein [Aestuariimicrobium ganziense]